MFLTEAVFILICCCALLKFISNMQYIIIYFKMILPENEFSLLKGVNNQPYLDIWTSASHLTKRFLFSCISFFFLPSYVFYIHPIGHLWAFWLCVKTSLNMQNHSYDLHQPTDSFHDNQTHLKVSHEDLFWNRGTRIHSSMSCSQEPMIYVGMVALSATGWYQKGPCLELRQMIKKLELKNYHKVMYKV